MIKPIMNERMHCEAFGDLTELIEFSGDSNKLL